MFVLNFVIIYRGLSKGIEFICNWGMPLLIAIALILPVRVLTLGTPELTKPEPSVCTGRAYLLKPHDIARVRSNQASRPPAGSPLFLYLPGCSGFA